MMSKYSDFVGAIFDVDDTLLDNLNRHEDGNLHTRSRFLATREVGRRRGMVVLRDITFEQVLQAWFDSKVHSLEGAVWQTLLSLGLVAQPNIDHDNDLLKEISKLKDELHEDILREHAQEFPGASAFVKALAKHGLRLSIASTAIRRDIDVFLEKVGLSAYFPSKNIISKENVTHLKPHPEVFEKAFKSFGLPDSARQHVLAFEDDPRGITSAKSTGLYVCAITGSFDRAHLAGLADPPDLVADDFNEFADLLDLRI